jgi:hypothetical protein
MHGGVGTEKRRQQHGNETIEMLGHLQVSRETLKRHTDGVSIGSDKHARDPGI